MLLHEFATLQRAINARVASLFCLKLLTSIDGSPYRARASRPSAPQGISEYTVKHHLTSVYDKLGVYNRVELVLFAMNHGLCSVPAMAWALANAT
jgi:hypothetical protein